MVTVLIGSSGCGKNYIQNILINKYNYIPIISTTTRPIRTGEINGVDYFFTDKDHFINMINNKNLIEYREYHTLLNGESDTWYYGIEKQTFNKNKNYVVILDIEGTKSLIKYANIDNCKVIYTACKYNTRLERAQLRGGFDWDEWNRRKIADEADFIPSKYMNIMNKYINNNKGYDIDRMIEEAIK